MIPFKNAQIQRIIPLKITRIAGLTKAVKKCETTCRIGGIKTINIPTITTIAQTFPICIEYSLRLWRGHCHLRYCYVLSRGSDPACPDRYS